MKRWTDRHADEHTGRQMHGCMVKHEFKGPFLPEVDK